MSNVMAARGDFIHIATEPEIVSITFVERSAYLKGAAPKMRTTTMDFDAAQIDKMIEKLKKALDEMEGM